MPTGLFTAVGIYLNESENQDTYSTVDSDYEDVPNLTISKEFTGESPPLITLINDGTNAGSISIEGATISIGRIQLVRNTVVIYQTELETPGGKIAYPLSSFFFIDHNPISGIVEYKLQAKLVSGPGPLKITEARLITMEI